MRSALDCVDLELVKQNPNHQSSLTIEESGVTLNEFCKSPARFFTIVREPVSRFWSAYKNRILEKPESRIVSKIAKFHNMKNYKSSDITPELTLDYVEHCPTQETDEHLRPQWACCGFGRIEFDYIAKVESLNDDLQRMVELELIHPQTVSFFGQKNKSSCAVDDAVQKRLRARIEQLYAKDFSTFEYKHMQNPDG